MNKQKHLESLYYQACMAGLCKTRLDFANFIGINEQSLSKAMNGDERYLTDKLFEKIDKKLAEKGVAITTAENVGGDNLQGENLQNRVNSDEIISRFLDEIAAQRKLTEEAQRLTAEAQRQQAVAQEQLNKLINKLIEQ